MAQAGPGPEPQELLHASWKNRVPIRLTLSPDNISSPTDLKPLYVLVPRLGYLSTLATQAWPQLQHVLPAVPGRGTLRPWFDCNGLPLRWWFPCGVLFDLLAPSTAQIPWPLQIHYTPLPDVLAGWDNGASLQTQYFHSLKEACLICKGSEGSGAVMRMTGAAQDQLWAAIERGDGPSVTAALSALRIQPTQRQGQPASIPVRLIVRPSEATSTTSGALWDQLIITSRPVPLATAAGEQATLATLLATLLPAMFPSPAQPSSSTTAAAPAAAAAPATSEAAAAGSDDAGKAAAAEAMAKLTTADDDAGAAAGDDAAAAADAATPPAASHPLQEEAPASDAAEQASTAGEGSEQGGLGAAADGSSPAAAAAPAPAPAPAPAAAVVTAQPGWPRARVLVAGIEPPMEAPLAWLHASLQAADMFLYVVVRLDQH